MKRIFGWIIFLIGILIVGGTLYYSYLIFTAQKPAPQFFKMPPLAQEKSKIPSQKLSLTKQKLPEQMNQLVEKQLKNIFPPEATTKLLNLIVFSVGAGIFIFGGSQIASLGIKLIK